MKSKEITFDYYQPLNTDDKQFNLMKLINFMEEQAFQERVMEYKDGNKVRLSGIKYHSNYISDSLKIPLSYPLLQLIFTRIRPELPGIASETSPDLEPLELPTNKKLGENVNVLYDEELNLLLIQKNRDGVSVSGIEKFFNSLLKEDPLKVCFAPLINKDTFSKLQQANICKSITIRLVDTSDSQIKEWVKSNPASLANIINIANNSVSTANLQAEFLLRPKNKNEASFSIANMKKLVKSSFGLISDGKIDKMLLGVDTSKNPLNIISCNEKEFIKVQLQDNNFILDTTIFDKIVYQYSQKRNIIKDLIRM